MKYKSIGAIACIAILLVGSLNWNLLFGLTTEKRIHQHLSYVPKQKCEQTHNDGELCTHLPLISIDTNGQEIPGKGMKDKFRRQFCPKSLQPGVGAYRMHDQRTTVFYG